MIQPAFWGLIHNDVQSDSSYFSSGFSNPPGPSSSTTGFDCGTTPWLRPPNSPVIRRPDIQNTKCKKVQHQHQYNAIPVVRSRSLSRAGARHRVQSASLSSKPSSSSSPHKLSGRPPPRRSQSSSSSSPSMPRSGLKIERNGTRSFHC